MAIRKKTERQLEEVYQRNLNCKGSFSEEESPELHKMCMHCDVYSGSEHDYTECRDSQCFKNWLALEYLDWIKGAVYNSYYDYSGYHVIQYRCHCQKCGKKKIRKYY